MLDIFSGLRLVVKRRSISIDNAIFRCHWFFTSTLLVSFSLIITARQYVGQPIECHSFNKIPDSLLNSYCWVQSTFTVPQACNQQVGVEVPYPCIDNTRGREIKMFAYYQWVGMVLFIQGLLFHLPYYLWKVWENGLIRAITGGLRVAVLTDQERVKKRDVVVEYIHDHLGCHKRYAFKYFLCEFICLINLLAQLWATNKFFDGQFLRYGIDVVQYSSSSLGLSSPSTASNSSLLPDIRLNSSTSSIRLASTMSVQSTFPAYLSKASSASIDSAASRARTTNNQVDPMTYIFPRMTKCTYYDFGSSGDIQKHDALCLLPLNIINEKIYIALWFWFLILAILTLLVIIYRVLAIFSRGVRCKGLISRCKLSNELDVQKICTHCDVGDWFLFYMVAENLDPLVMREIVASVARKIDEHFELKKSLADAQVLQARNSICKFDPLNPTLNIRSPPSSRRTSFADDIPLVRKVRKRLYSKRLWSMDLGPAELRQQLFGQQPPTNPDVCTEGEARTTSVHVSAPPASEMPLGARHLQRRSSLTLLPSGSSMSSGISRGSSTNSTSSFIMEMQTISSSQTNADQRDSEVSRSLRRQLSAQEQSNLRHRVYSSHSHHESIGSLKDLASNCDRHTQPDV